jgi:PilZ domain-containing protein
VEKQAATLLKVRFGDLSQLQNHLHVVGGRTVFFFREATSRLEGAERVVVEFSIATSEQVSTLRGTVLGRVEGGESGQTGAWVEFPDAKLAKRLERGATALGTRQHQRVMCDLTVEVKHGRRPFLARMMDVSMGGARILGATAVRVGAMPLRTGAAVGLRIVGAEPPFPSDLGRADAVRVDLNTGELAVRWVRSDPVVRAASMKLIDAARGSWAQAQEMIHTPSCCQNGNVLDPPMPTMKRRL